LQEVTERLPESRVTVHARIALGNAVAVERKRLELGDGAGAAVPAYMAGGRIVPVRADETAARKQLATALIGEKNIAAETLGHIDYKEYAVSFAAWLVEKGQVEEATRVLSDLYQTLAGRKVLERVLAEIKKLHDEYGAMQGEAKPPGGRGPRNR